jgi:hypothetical protein
MAYKSLNDRLRRNVLRSFLDAASALTGNLVIFLIDRRIRSLFSDPGDERLLPELVVAERGWNRRSFHRLLALSSLGALLVSGLSGSGQDILWLTDEDEIAPNPTKHSHAGHVIHHCIERYAPSHKGTLVFLTTQGRFDNCFREDIVAVTDLAAGALVDVFSRGDIARDRRGSHLWIPASVTIPTKAATILRWLARESGGLGSVVIVLETAHDALDVRVFRPVCAGDHLLVLA